MKVGSNSIPVFLLLLVLFSCSSPREQTSLTDVPLRYGVIEAYNERQLVDSAVEIANLILEPTYVRLKPSWKTSNTEAVAVFLLRDTGLAASDFIFIPKQSKYVFIREKALLDNMALYCEEDSSGQMGIDPAQFLAIALLHESGHVYFKDSDANIDTTPADIKDYNFTSSPAKNRELRADSFALAQIKLAFNDKKNTDRFLAASALTMAVGKMSWNLLKGRLLDNFGSSSVSNKPFWDEGFTHPNFELRYLIMNYNFNPSPAAKQNLDHFIERRRPNSDSQFRLFP